MGTRLVNGVDQPTRIRFGVLGFACGLSLLTYLDRICMMPVKEAMATDLGLSDIQMGWVFSAFTLGYMLCEIPGGWMGDRWGARRVLTRIVLFWSLFTLLTGMVWKFSWAADGGWLAFDSFLLLLLVRFLFGIGAAGAYPNLTRVIHNWFPYRERGLASGGIWMSARLGAALAPPLIGGFAVYVGWRQAFWVLGLLGLVWAMLFFWWYRDHPEEHHACNDAERQLIHDDVAPQDARAPAHGHGLPPPPTWSGFWTLAAICLVAACINFGWYFIPTWQAQYYLDVHGIPYKNSLIHTGLPFVFGALGCLLGGRVSDWLVRRTGSRRWGRSLLGVVGFTLTGGCMVGLGFASNQWEALTLLCLVNLFNDVAVPVIWAVCADVGGRHVGSVAGLMNMMGGVGAILSPILIPRMLSYLPALPNLATRAAVGLGVVQAVPNGWETAARWQIIFSGLAIAWFIGAVAWLFVNAGKPVFAEDNL